MRRTELLQEMSAWACAQRSLVSLWVCRSDGFSAGCGTINRAGLKHLAESLDTIAVMARTIADCALTVHAVSSRNLPDFEIELSTPPRIGFCRTSRWRDASPATHSLLEDAAFTLAKRGAEVHEFALPDEFDKLYEEQQLISNFEAARGLAPERFTHPEQLSDELRGRLETHSAMPRRLYADAMRHARSCRQQFSQLLLGIDVLLTPSAPDEAPKGIMNTGNAVFNRIWTLLGVPCVTIPAGYGPRGLPLGVQVVGDYDEDEKVLLCAEWMKHALS